MNKALEQSIKEKIKAISKKQGRTFNDVWQEVILERWLARLAHSPYRKNFIFKGAMCLLRYIELHRETRDLDFLIQDLKASIDEIKDYLTQVSEIPLNDGVSFQNLEVGPLAHFHMKYPGYSISVIGQLGNTKTKIFIDVGVGDAVKPTELTMKLLSTDKAPLFEKELSLWAYPIESIFAEKLETAISRADQNSRMKDYHDLVVLIRSEIIDTKKLGPALQETFKNRNTILKTIMIPQDQFSTIQRYWTQYLKGLPKNTREELDINFQIIINTINSYLINQFPALNLNTIN